MQPGTQRTDRHVRSRVPSPGRNESLLPIRLHFPAVEHSKAGIHELTNYHRVYEPRRALRRYGRWHARMYAPAFSAAGESAEPETTTHRLARPESESCRHDQSAD